MTLFDYEVEPTRTRINLSVMKADILDCGEFDFVLAGNRSPFVHAARAEGVRSVEKAEVGLISHSWSIFSNPLPQWKTLGSINYRPRKVSENERNSSRMTDALSWAITRKRIPRIGILPFSWRYPETVAVETIYALWLLGHGAATVGLPFADPEVMNQAQFFIVSRDGIDPYQEVIDHDFERLWRYLGVILSQSCFLFEAPKLDELKEYTTFNIKIS